MPDWIGHVRAAMGFLNLEPTTEAQIVEELAHHMDDRYQELLLAGMTPDDANRTLLTELDSGELRDGLEQRFRPKAPSLVLGYEDSESWVGGTLKDLGYAARLLRLNPTFAAVAILSLALGVGANTTIFQLLDAVRLRTLPVRDPQQLADVRIVKSRNRTGDFRGENPQLTNVIWEQIRDRQQAFTSIGAWSSQKLNLSPGGEARYVQGLWVSGAFFETLGVVPLVGHLIAPWDDRPGCGSAGLVISHSFWEREFGGESVLGRSLRVEGHPFQIVGVTSPSFFGVEVGRNFDIALPLCAEPIVNGEDSFLRSGRTWWLAAIGRLKPGWSTTAASAHLAAISQGIFQSTVPSTYDPLDRKDFLDFQLGAIPAASGVSTLRKRYENPLWLLMGIATLVLLIACANLTNLMMARAKARHQEIVVRLALGASRARLMRQLLAESALIAVMGAALGVGLAQLLSRLMVSFLSTQQTQWFLDLTLDWRVLAFIVGVSVLTCFAFGLAPAINASRSCPGDVMNAGGRRVTTGRDRVRLRQGLVVSQVALSLVLLMGALLFVRTLRNLVSLNTGFQRDSLLITDVDLSPLHLSGGTRVEYKQELLARIRSIPGVVAAAQVSHIPVSGSGWNENITIPGSQIRREIANFDQVSAGYFRTMGIAQLLGRDFNESDRVASTPVAVVTQKFAQKFLGGADPIGRTIQISDSQTQVVRTLQIIGMVNDVKYTDLREEFTPIVFVAETQDLHPYLGTRLIIRSSVDASELTSSVRQTLAQINPKIVITFDAFQNMIEQSLLRERLMASLAGCFGLLAAILSMVGLYGVISYMAARRKNEFGIRVALGANRRDIISMIMREAGILLGIGLLLGIALTFLASNTARTFLYGLKPNDLPTLILAMSLLALTALAATVIPAHRAATLDPMQALREE